jgi:hypothetical protein
MLQKGWTPYTWHRSSQVKRPPGKMRYYPVGLISLEKLWSESLENSTDTAYECSLVMLHDISTPHFRCRQNMGQSGPAKCLESWLPAIPDRKYGFANHSNVLSQRKNPLAFTWMVGLQMWHLSVIIVSGFGNRLQIAGLARLSITLRKPWIGILQIDWGWIEDLRIDKCRMLRIS